MTRQEALALAKIAARGIALLDELTKKYGHEPPDNGAVVRFTLSFAPQPFDAFPPDVRDPQPWRRQTHSFMYAAIRANGLWYLTGSDSPQGIEWEQLLAWIEDHASLASEIECWPSSKKQTVLNEITPSTGNYTEHGKHERATKLPPFDNDNEGDD